MPWERGKTFVHARVYDESVHGMLRRALSRQPLRGRGRNGRKEGTVYSLQRDFNVFMYARLLRIACTRAYVYGRGKKWTVNWYGMPVVLFKCFLF